jgi:hypothetical protein
MWPIVQPVHAMAMSTQSAIVTAVIVFKTGDNGPTVEVD